ncbi:MAG TPA: PAS domain-containing protein [Gaiellaceae bacterium]|nr:PAS domain-containing protein [Gaiellaceae bacterium]
MLLLVAVFGVGLLTESPEEPGAILHAIPVVLVAIALGAVAGSLAGVLAGALFWIAVAYHDADHDALEIGYRIVGSSSSGASPGRLPPGSSRRSKGASASYLGLLHPEDRELVDSTVRHSFGSDQPFSFTHRLVRPNGEVRFVQSNGRAFLENETTVRMAGTALDVTERILAEREAADAHEELALREELGRRAVELNDEVVQGLALSGYLLSAGDAEAATASLRATLGRAQKLVGDLIDADGLEAGGLRRERPAEID